MQQKVVFVVGECMGDINLTPESHISNVGIKSHTLHLDSHRFPE